MPVRRIPISNRALTGRHAVFPGGKSRAFESSIERDFISLMLLDPSVVDIEEQPVRIVFTDDEGKRRRYTPDFRVDRIGAPTILAEVKPSKNLKPEMTKYFDAGAKFAEARGWKFAVWTEKDIRNDRLKNARFLEMYRGRRINQELAELILSGLARPEISTVGDLVGTFDGDDEMRAEKLSTLWCLIASGSVKVDLDHEIDPDSELRADEGVGNGK